MYQSVITDPGGDRFIRIVPDIRPVDGSVLIVPADTVAYFVFNGQVSERYGPGRHTIKTGVFPFFVKLRHIMKHGDPAIRVTVFFVSCDIENTCHLGSGEFIFRERRFNISMKALAGLAMRYRIKNPDVLLKRLVGMHSTQFYIEDLDPALNSMLLPIVREQLSIYLGKSNIYEFNNELTRLSRSVSMVLRPSFAEYGLELIDLSVSGINVTDEEMSRLHQLEGEYAAGKNRTDLEKYNVEQVYGNIDKRIISDALTGTVRGDSNGAAPRGAGSDIAQFMALPYIMEMYKRFMDGMSLGTPSGATSGGNAAQPEQASPFATGSFDTGLAQNDTQHTSAYGRRIPPPEAVRKCKCGGYYNSDNRCTRCGSSIIADTF